MGTLNSFNLLDRRILPHEANIILFLASHTSYVWLDDRQIRGIIEGWIVCLHIHFVIRFFIATSTGSLPTNILSFSYVKAGLGKGTHRQNLVQYESPLCFFVNTNNVDGTFPTN